MKYLWALALFAIGEILSFLIFIIVKKNMVSKENSTAIKGATAKGILERAVMLTGLLHGFPQILIAFGALKLGTRLHDDKNSEISNNYFLLGNLISILLAMVYAIIIQGFWNS